MKKLTIALALVLCLVLCVFAFASCGKKNKKADTTVPVTEPDASAQQTTAQQTTAPATTTKAAHVHVIPEDWDEHNLVDPTCQTEGTRVKYCEECGEIVAQEQIPADPNAHVVEDWTIVEPTLFEPVGSKSGTCKVCEQKIDIVLNWELTTYSSAESTGKYIEGVEFAVNKTVEEIRGDKSFAPTEDDPDGNDLWFEYSLLYNSTLYNHDYPNSLSEIRLFCFRESTNRSSYRGFYYLYLRDNMDPFKTSGDCPFRGHIDYSTYLLDWPGWSDETAYQCADDLTALGNTLNGKPIGQYMAGWAYCHPGGITKECSPYLWDSEWQTLNGWHRLGFRYHQDAAINEGTVVYSGYTELYIDGVLCWRIHSNYKPGHKDSLVTKNLLLWTAEIDPENPEKLVYTNHDSMMVGMRMDNFKQASKEVLIAIDDVRWTCGDGFAVPVKRVENPKPVPTTLKEGVDDVIAMYFAKPDCVHEAEDEWVVIKEATLLEAGTKAKYCAKCGERMETEAIPYEPIVYLTNWDAAARAASPYSIDNPDDHKDTFGFKEAIKDVRGEDHFYDGKDLLIEFSFLYNETMANASSDGTLTVMYIENNNLFNINMKTGKIDATNRTGDVVLYKADESGKIPIGEYGWHRFAVRIHQDAVNNAGEVQYSVIATAYLDGVKILEVDKTTYALSKHNGGTGYTGLLYTATVENDELVYADNSKHCDVYVMVECIYANENDANPGYVVVADVDINCAAEFVQDVEKVATPAAATYEIATGVTVPAAMYYQAKTE